MAGSLGWIRLNSSLARASAVSQSRRLPIMACDSARWRTARPVRTWLAPAVASAVRCVSVRPAFGSRQPYSATKLFRSRASPSAALSPRSWAA